MYILFVVMTLVTTITSCVHEWPDASSPVKINLEMVVDDKDSLAQKITRGDLYDIRYTVAAYRQLQDGRYPTEESERFTFTKDEVRDPNNNVSIELVPGKYKIYVWTDYILHESTEDLFYDITNLRNVVMIGGIQEYKANNDYKNAFTGTKEIEIEHRPSSMGEYTYDISLKSPLARFELIATDVKAFITKQTEAMMNGTKSPVNIDLNDYLIRIHYLHNIPNTFNIITNKATDIFEGRVSFESKMVRLDDETVLLAHDYIFINESQSTINIAIEVFNNKGEIVSYVKEVEIELTRSENEGTHDNFLTSEAKGGIGVDPGFSGPDIDYGPDYPWT